MKREKMLTDDSIERFRQYLLDRGRSELTARAYCSDLTTFLAQSGLPCVELKKMDSVAMTWLRTTRRTTAQRTTCRRAASLRAWAKYAGRPILTDYILPTPARTEPHPLPGGIAQVRECLAAATEPHHRALVTLCGLLGLRISEALDCERNWFDLREMELTVRGKGDKSRTIPISSEAWDNLASAYLHATPYLVPISDSSARRYLKRITGYASHSYRATVATEANDSGANIRTVQEILGHASLTTTQIYTKVSAEAKREALEF